MSVPQDDLSLRGKTAVVTGAGRGIGRAIALTLAEYGADVAVAARSLREIQETAAEVARLGRRSLAVATDVSRSEDVDRLVQRVLGELGAIEILVNNAGCFAKQPLVPLPDRDFRPPFVPRPVFGRTSDDEWRRVFDVNVHGVFYGCRAVAPHMIERGGGKIINVSSNSAIQAAPYVAAYNASKASVNMLTRVLALEWADYNIRVNAVAPGEYHTALTDFSWSDPGEKAKRLARIPLHREGDLRELGIAVVYLASSAGDYITGQIIHIDGGLTAR